MYDMTSLAENSAELFVGPLFFTNKFKKVNSYTLLLLALTNKQFHVHARKEVAHRGLGNDLDGIHYHQRGKRQEGNARIEAENQRRGRLAMDIHINDELTF